MLKKLYDKSELWFALLFILVYCITNIMIRGKLGDESIWMLLANIIITIITVIFIKKNKLESKYGLDRLPKNSKRFLYFIPLIILGTCNLWTGFKLDYIGLPLLYASISMILIGWIEEIIFRGFLFKAVEKEDGIKKAIIISAVTFGIGHILNLISQPGIDTLMQVLYAISFGFLFVYLFIKSKSLWPCIILHSFINVTSKYGNASNIYVITAILIVTSVLYGLYLRKLKD